MGVLVLILMVIDAVLPTTLEVVITLTMILARVVVERRAKRIRR